MLRAAGFRLLRLSISVDRIASKRADPVGHTRKACVMKGLILSSDLRNPSMPYRYREISSGVVELEQIQLGKGAAAVCPPEQPDFLERFLAGEKWAGVVKSAPVA